MNIRKFKKYWHKILPNTKKIPKKLLYFYMWDEKLMQKYLKGEITIDEYLYQREKYQHGGTNKKQIRYDKGTRR